MRGYCDNEISRFVLLSFVGDNECGFVDFGGKAVNIAPRHESKWQINIAKKKAPALR